MAPSSRATLSTFRNADMIEFLLDDDRSGRRFASASMKSIKSRVLIFRTSLAPNHFSNPHSAFSIAHSIAFTVPMCLSPSAAKRDALVSVLSAKYLNVNWRSTGCDCVMLRARSAAACLASIRDVSLVLLTMYFWRALSQIRTYQYWLPLTL